MKLTLRLLSFFILYLIQVNAFSQGGNTCAQAASAPVTLPFTATGQSTCADADNFNGTINCASPSSLYTTGPDHFYVFTAPSTGNVSINLTNISPASHYGSIIVFQGCPSPAGGATNCVSGTSATSGNLVLNVPVTSGVTYYVMIDNWPTPACINYDISIGTPAPPQGGDLCTSPINVTTPYCGTGQMTCGMSDNFNGTINCGTPSSLYTTGPDVFYSFTATSTGSHQVQLTNTSPASHYGSIIVFQGCPTSSTNATNCVAGTSVTSGNFGLSFNATAGVTYYVMIDNWPSPACFYYDICIGPTPTSTLQPPCTNLGYESGTTGWFGTNGTVSNGGMGAPSPIYTANSFGVFAPQTSIMTGAGTDPYGGFPVVFAGAQSIRIGDGTGTNYGGASVEQLFQVTNANSNFTYNYAVVLQDGGHANYEQPFFQVEVYDQAGNPISCGNYLITAPGTGFVQSTVDATVWYKPWTPVSINLLSYVGQNVRVKFTSGDCAQGGHYGYAYVDCSCASYTIVPTTICNGQTGVISAPNGALSYSWTPGGATTYSTSVSPTVTTTYTCQITSQGTTPCGGSLTTTVTVLPSPTVTATSATVCVGQGGTLTASGASTYTWSPATGLSSTTGSTVTATPGSSQNYTVTGSNGSCATTGTCAVTVIPTPTLTVNSPTICRGNSTTLNASGATTYSWTPATGLSATTGASVTANPTVTTTYTVIGTSGSCTTTATSIVTVNPTPTVTVNSATLCSGTSTTLNASGATTYSWSPGTGLSGTTGASVTANPTVTTTYTIVGTTGTCTSSITSTVTINPTPTLSVNSATICRGASTTLTATGATTYSWSPGSGLSATTGASVVSSPTATTTYTIVGTTGTCTSSVTSTVTVNPTPTITVNSPTICSGTSTTLNAGGATTYSWGPGTGLSGTTGASVTANPTVTTTYTVVGTLATCTSSATSTVTVTPTPTVTVNSPTLCVGGSTTLNAGGATTYSWTPGTGLSSTTGGTVTANPGTTTTYTVIGTTATCTAQAVTTVTVNPTPTITVNNPTMCPGNTATLTATGASTYTWAPAGTLSSSTGTTVNATPTVTTTYTITGTSVAGCTATATSTVTIGGSITPVVNSATICAGNSTTLTATGGTTYTWSPGTGLSSTSGSTVTANPGATTTYTITGSTSGCTGTTTAVVTVDPLPVVTVNSPSICVGNSTTLNASGATTYSWSPGTGLSGTTGASVTANPTVTTTYTVVGTSATCTAQAVTTITVNPTPTVTVNNGTVCNGGSVVLTASGASTYTWSPGTGLSATTGASVTGTPTVTTNYTVSATSAAGCPGTATTSITVVTNPTLTVNSATICMGDSATLNASGTVTYSWSPATGLSATTGSTVTANPATTTTYTIVGTSGTCTTSATAVVTVNPLPVVTVNSGTICAGQTTATLTAGGATTYSWSPSTGLSSSSGSPVVANPGSTTGYTVTGTDANNCVNTATTAVTVNATPTLSVNSGFICNGSTATLTATGASTYTWSPATGLSSTNGSTVTGNPPSTTQYTVTGTDANGCIDSDTTSITIVSNPTVTVNAAAICIGDSTTLTANGASSYVWTPGTGLSSTTGGSVTAFPTTTTVYTITGTAGTCSAVTTTTVTVNPLPAVTVNSGTICIGQQTATLTAGGASTYTWSPSTGLSSANGSPVSATPTVTSSYTVTGTDANGCVNTATTTVNVNPLPTITLNSGFVCNGSSATLNAGGASTYSWSPGTGLSATTGSSVNASPASTTQYTVTGTDVNGCVNSDTTSVTVVNNPTVTVNAATICINDSTTLTATGAATYVWSPATGLSSTSGTSVTANPTATTVYTITGTAGTCTAVATTTVTVNPLPVITVNSGTICIGQQTATLTAGGASSYTWSPSTGLSSANGSPVSATPTVTSSYTVTGTDVNGCVNTETTTVTVNPLPILSLSNALICVGSSTPITATGATTYSWSPGTGLSSTTGGTVTANPTTTTNYTVVGTDANGCVNSDTTTITVVTNPTVTVNTATICVGQQTATLTANGASTYVWSPATGLSATSGPSVTANPGATTVYTITGTAGTCTAVGTTTVTVNPLPTVTVSSNSPLCVNQNLNLNSGGGTSYSWNGPNSFSSSQQNPGVNGVTLADAGIYTVTVTDANTCVNTNTVSVVVNPLPVVVVTGDTVCMGFTINLGCNNSGVTYSWTGPLSFSSNQQSPSISNATTNMSGSYVVTVTDANGCASGNVAQVLVNPSLVINAVNNGPLCENTTLVLATSAGISWAWSGPNGFSSSSQMPSIPNVQLSASGTYTVVGTDANGCTGTATTTVVVNPLPVVTVNSGTICVTQTAATLTANGAVTYAWSPSTTLSSASGSPVTATPSVTTVYTITAVDANNCANTATSTVTVNQLPTIAANSPAICFGGSATISANGAVSYTWSPSTGLSSSSGSPVTANPTSTTGYTVTGTDANGCYNTGTCTVTVNALPNVTVTSGTVCAGNITALSALGANTYSWSPAQWLNATTGATVYASPVSTSTYIVTGTDINGCSSTDTAVVTVNPLPIVNAGPQITTGCEPVCVTLSNTSSSSGVCSWSFGDGTTSTNCTPTHCYTGKGTYYAVLIMADANGCKGVDTAMVIVYPVPDADFTFGPQPTTIFESLINFYDNSSGAIITNWNWNFGDPNSTTSTYQNPSFDYYNPGTYDVQLIVTSDYGCKDSVIKTVVIADDFSIYVPNAFTPNFDGTNDVFMAKGEGIKEFTMWIFDRWGNQVFFSEDIYKGWDGRFQAKGETIVQEDVYVWKIELKNFRGEPKQLKGTVSLLK